MMKFFRSLQLQGFSLIEMLVVFAIIGTTLVGSMAAFSSYNREQMFRASVADVAFLLHTAKSRAISYVKPTQCSGKTLQAYQVSISPPSTYQLGAFCDTTLYPLQTPKTLATNVTFSSGTPIVVSFAVATGTIAQQQTITIVGYGNSKTITVAPSGIISVP